MKVEIITSSADPDHGGFGARVHALVSMFSQFADVNVVLTDWFGGPRLPGVRYEEIPLPESPWSRLRRFRTYYRTDFPERPHSDPPDVAIVSSLDLLGLFQYGDEVPLVLDEHNVYWDLIRYDIVNAPFFRGSLGRRRLVRRLLIPSLLERAKRFEMEAIRHADRTLVTSEADRRAVVAACPDVASKVHVVPNCVDSQRIPPQPHPRGSRTVSFVGDYNYVPNREAADFVSRVLAPSLPDARLLLVGPNGPTGALAPNVFAMGHVPDLLAVLRDTAVCIAPLFHGSGTRLKILTYLAAARPVVATTKACEGLPVRDGQHLLLRDDPREFRDAVEDLLDSPGRQRDLGAAGRQLVESTFDWRVHVPHLRDLSQDIVAEAAS